MAKAYNKQIMALLRSWDLHSSASRLHYGPIFGRYERGSKINKTSHVLDLRHVVAGLSALK